MTEKQEGPPPSSSSPVTLSLDLFVAFLTAKNVPDSCPACQKTDGWYVTGANNEGSQTPVELVIPYMTRDYQDRYKDVLLYGEAVVSTACTHCGFMRLFSRKAVEDWVKEKNQQGG